MQLATTISLYGGGPGSGCQGPNCGRRKGADLGGGVNERDAVNRHRQLWKNATRRGLVCERGCEPLAGKLFEDVFEGRPGWGLYETYRKGQHGEHQGGQEGHVFIAGHGLTIDPAAGDKSSLLIVKDTPKVGEDSLGFVTHRLEDDWKIRRAAGWYKKGWP
jgi:hypothetical protein